MAKLCEGCTDHLREALRAEDPATKNYHIREVLQACSVEDVPEELDVELAPTTSD
jgi:hypothetical protein